jgi:hypothetical protein
MEDEEAVRLETKKEMTVLGFTPLKNIARHYYMSNVLAVVPMDQGKAYSALVAALYELQCACIVRYCRVDNASPRMGCLLHMKKGYAYFVQVTRLISCHIKTIFADTCFQTLTFSRRAT